MAFITSGPFFKYVLGFYPGAPWLNDDDEEYCPFDIVRTKDANLQVCYVLSLFQRPAHGLVEDYDGAPRDHKRGFSRPKIFYFSTEFVDSL
jgi:hypothetical protein